MTINQHNSVSHAFSVHSSSIIAYPVNPIYTSWERSLNAMPRTLSLSIYIYIIYIYMYIYIYIYMTLVIDMDFLYQFNMGLIAPLYTVSFHEMFEKKCFFKFSKFGRSVIGWRSGLSCCDLWIYGGRGFFGVPPWVLFTSRQGFLFELLSHRNKRIVIKILNVVRTTCYIIYWHSSRIPYIWDPNLG